MANTLTIKVEVELPDDMTDLRLQILDSVENVIEEYQAENEGAGKIEVSWDVDTDDEEASPA